MTTHPLEPLRIFLVRHGVSEANLDKTVNFHKPDHAVELAPKGHEQARAAGQAIVDFISGGIHGRMPRGGVRILCSPYLRTRQTAAGIEAALIDATIPFDKREALELREMSFGLFDGIPDEDLAERFPLESAHYEKAKRASGEFWARMPMGESRVEVADRVKGCFGTILRDASPEREKPIRTFIVVAHGISIRAFRLQWMHRPWEWYEAEPNPANCSVLLIEKNRDARGYSEERVFAGFPHLKAGDQERREGGHVGAEATSAAA